MYAVPDQTRAKQARAEILAENPGAALEVRRIDLADLGSVAAFADTLMADGRPLDTLINNAGVMAPPTRHTTSDGFELQFGSNFLGGFALTTRLLPLVLTADSPRVVTMSSGVARFGRIAFDDLQWERRRYSPMGSYAQSKLADLMMSLELARIADARGWTLRSIAAHPGFTRTNLQSAGASLGRDKPKKSMVDLPLLPSQDVQHGAEPLLFAAADPDAAQGGYYGPRGRFGPVGPTAIAKIPRRAEDRDVASLLWAEAERLSGAPVRV